MVPSFVLKQLRDLAAEEGDLEARFLRIEHIVEGQVEFEQLINEMWFSMRAENEAQGME